MGCPGEGVGEWINGERINGLVVTHLERTVLGGPNPFSGGVWMSRVSSGFRNEPSFASITGKGTNPTSQ